MALRYSRWRSRQLEEDEALESVGRFTHSPSRGGGREELDWSVFSLLPESVGEGVVDLIRGSASWSFSSLTRMEEVVGWTVSPLSEVRSLASLTALAAAATLATSAAEREPTRPA